MCTFLYQLYYETKIISVSIKYNIDCFAIILFLSIIIGYNLIDICVQLYQMSIKFDIDISISNIYVLLSQLIVD